MNSSSKLGSNSSSEVSRKILGWSYLSHLLGFGPSIAIVLFWIYRREGSQLRVQLVQSVSFQIALMVAIVFVNAHNGWLAFVDSGYSASFYKLVYEFLIFLISLAAGVVCFLLSLVGFSSGTVILPGFYQASCKLEAWLRRPTPTKAAILNSLLPGLGQLQLGQGWLGWSFVAVHGLMGVLIVYWLICFYNFPLAKLLLTTSGFTIRLSDRVFAENFLTVQVIGSLVTVLLINYAVSWITLPFGKLKSTENKTPGIWFSVNTSVIVNFGVLISLLLLPMVISGGITKQSVQQRSEEIAKKLESLSKSRKPAQKIEDVDVPEPSRDETNLQQLREMNFDLTLPSRVEGLNDFVDRSLSKDSTMDAEPVTPPQIGYGKRQPMQTVDVYKKKLSRSKKSYSEYLTAKIREDDRDLPLWRSVSDKVFSIVLRYKIERDGTISKIELVEGSEDYRNDALAIAVIESMNPMLHPPNGRGLEVTELFWNFDAGEGLPTDLQRKLSQYPDGRYIKEF